MRVNYLIHTGHDVGYREAKTTGSPHNNSPVNTENLEQKGYLIIRNIWQRGTESIHYMRVVNTDTPSHRKKLSREVYLDG